MSQFGGSFIMGILQMGWNRQIAGLFHCLHRFLYRHTAGIALGRTGHIGCRLRQNNLSLRHTDSLHCQRSIGSHNKRLRIRIAHILRGANHDSSGNKSHLFPGIQHPCQIIDRSIRIRASHAFDESRDGIIVIVSGFVVAHDTLLDTFFGNLEGNMNLTVLSRRGSHDTQFHRIQGMSGIATGQLCQKINCFILYLRLIDSHTPVHIIDCFSDQLFDCLHRNRFQFKDNGAGNQRAIYFKIGIFRGGTD